MDFKTQGNIESQPVSKSPVVFFIEEESRRFCLNHIKPLSHCSPNIWINQSCFLMSNWFSASQHPFTDKAMVITETPIPRTLLATSSTCSTKSLLTQFILSLFWIRQNQASERRTLLTESKSITKALGSHQRNIKYLLFEEKLANPWSRVLGHLRHHTQLSTYWPCTQTRVQVNEKGTLILDK